MSIKALFIPTARGEAEGYCETFDLIYGKMLKYIPFKLLVDND
ncbi:MAG: hypothetical protein ACPLSA_04080 [Caldanaerobacter sp.]